MKTQETSIAQMDEIVFEHRNKSYGAYFLRKMYNKHLARALFLAIAILIAGLAYPLVSSYRTIVRARYIVNEGGAFFNPKDTPPAAIPLPPPPPALPAELAKRVRFVTPDVVDTDVPESEGLPTQEYLNALTSIIPVDVSEEPATVKKEEIIKIEELSPPEIFVQEMPDFPGGDGERRKFLAENIQYPEEASQSGIQGTVYAQFIVDSKGNITDAKILRGIGGGCDEEALRVIKMMPQWHPGRQNGKTVRVLFNMPVVFKLQS
jgi:periplasmic protein TonB